MMVPTPDGDVHVEDARWSRPRHRGFRWSETRAVLSGIRRDRAYGFRREFGDVQLRRAEEAAEVEARADFDRRNPGVLHPADGFWCSLARLQSLPLERGPPLLVVRGEIGVSWRRSENPSWAGVDVRFCDPGGAAAAGSACDNSGENVVLLRWVGCGEPWPLPLNDSRVLTSVEGWPVAAQAKLGSCVSRARPAQVGEGRLLYWTGHLQLRLLGRCGSTGADGGVRSSAEPPGRQGQGPLRYHRGGCTLRRETQEVGRPHGLSGPVGLCESGGWTPAS